MADHVHRISDQYQQPAGSDRQGQLSLVGICSENSSSGCENRNAPAGGENYYNYYGDTSPTQSTVAGKHCRPGDQSSSGNGQQTPVMDNVPGKEVTLKSGDTFWALARDYYQGQEPIEAIYAANGLLPKVTHLPDGKIQLEDPTYYAGKTYVLPPASEIPALTAKYREEVAQLGQDSKERVGNANEQTDVKLIYGDTFWKLAEAKYDGQHPIAAIYEANGLTPNVVEKNGHCQLQDPIYYAGKTYTLPPESEIPALTRAFWQRMGHPEMCPPEYCQPGSSGQSQPTDQAPCTAGGGESQPAGAGESFDDYGYDWRESREHCPGGNAPPDYQPAPSYNTPPEGQPGPNQYNPPADVLPTQPSDPQVPPPGGRHAACGNDYGYTVAPSCGGEATNQGSQGYGYDSYYGRNFYQRNRQLAQQDAGAFGSSAYGYSNNGYDGSGPAYNSPQSGGYWYQAPADGSGGQSQSDTSGNQTPANTPGSIYRNGN